MAENEVEKLAGNLTDLNKITLQAGLEFKGFTKRLIEFWTRVCLLWIS